ncbi:MAG: thioredoxin [Ruminococcaceae bacterium]|nr:thioredoxin [Oscillospiraceae bacterium]
MALINVTEKNFKETVESGTVLLDFWATWCGPCQMIAPVVHEIAEEYPDVTVGKVNVDDEANLAASFKIVSIPTLIVIKDGKITAQAVGVQPKEKIIEMIK